MLPLNHSPWWTIMDINISYVECVNAAQVTRHPHLPWRLLTLPSLSQTGTLTVSGDQKFMALSETPCSESCVIPGKHWLTLSSWAFHEKKIKIITCTAVSQTPYALSQSAERYRTFGSPAGAMPSKLVNRALWANFVQSSAVPAPRREVQAVIHLSLPHKEPV